MVDELLYAGIYAGKFMSPKPNNTIQHTVFTSKTRIEKGSREFVVSFWGAQADSMGRVADLDKLGVFRRAKG